LLPSPAADTEAGILQGMRTQRRVVSTPLPDAAVSRAETYNNLFGSYIILIGACALIAGFEAAFRGWGGTLALLVLVFCPSFRRAAAGAQRAAL
jgi:hypothetical protein